MPEEELLIEIVNAHDAWCLQRSWSACTITTSSKPLHLRRAPSRAHCESNDQKRSRSEGKKTQRGANARWKPAQRRIDGYSTRHAHGPIRHRGGHGSTIALQGAQANPALLMEKLKNITINQLAQLQQFGVQLALCQAQLHGAGDFAPAHRSAIDFLRSTRQGLMEQLAEELKKDDGEQQILKR